MRDKMDRRQKKTRTAILNAFKTLLAQKRYSDITVQEIVDAANVGRSTFYSHFETKDGLLKELCNELFSHVTSNEVEAEKTHDFSKENTNTESIITHTLYHLQDYNIIGILSGESSEIFLPLFKQYLKAVFSKQLQGKLKKAEVPADFLLNYISCSFVDMIYWWIQNGKKESPEELERYLKIVLATVMQI